MSAAGNPEFAPDRRRTFWLAYSAILGILVLGTALFVVELAGVAPGTVTDFPFVLLAIGFLAMVFRRQACLSEPVWEVCVRADELIITSIPRAVRVNRKSFLGFDWKVPGVPRVVVRRVGGSVSLPLRRDQAEMARSWIGVCPASA